MHRGSWSLGDLSELLDQVFHAGYRKVLMELLSSVGIDDLWRDMSGALYASIEGEKLPMSALGDGTLSLVRLATIHSLVDKGFVIVEEPETAMHPGYLAFYANLMLNHALRGGVTIVISTHSYEFIDCVLELAKEKRALDRVAVVHLYRSDEGIEVSTYSDGEALERRKELYEDLRGL